MSTKKKPAQTATPAPVVSLPNEVPFVTELEESQALVVKQAARIAELEATLSEARTAVEEVTTGVAEQAAITQGAIAELDLLQSNLQKAREESDRLTTALERCLRFRSGRDLDLERFADGECILTIQGTCMAVQRKERTHDRLAFWQLVQCLHGDWVGLSNNQPEIWAPLRLPKREAAAE